jgi:hypothetical protein
MITRSKFSQFKESGIVKRILGLLFLLAVFGSTTRPPRAQGVPSGWAPLQFLLGEWVGEGAGTEGAGAGACSFLMDLKDHCAEELGPLPRKEGSPGPGPRRLDDYLSGFARCTAQSHSLRYRRPYHPM